MGLITLCSINLANDAESLTVTTRRGVLILSHQRALFKNNLDTFCVYFLKYISSLSLLLLQCVIVTEKLGIEFHEASYYFLFVGDALFITS